MPYCRICDIRKVPNEGDICPTCQDAMLQQRNTFIPNEPEEVSNDNNVQDAGDDTQDVYTGTSRRHRVAAPTGNTAQSNSNSGTSKRSIRNNPTPVNSAPVSAAPAPSQTQASKVPVGVAAAQANTQMNSTGAITEGVVRNIQKKQDMRKGLGKWFYCFAQGISYPRSQDLMEFQVFNNWNSTSNSSGVSADKVVVYGTIEVGEPVMDNTVRIYGKKLKNNYIIAEQIENTTDNTFATFNPAHISATAVRVITIAVILAIVGLGIFLWSLVSSGGGSGAASTAAISGGSSVTFSNILVKVIVTIIGVAAIIGAFRRGWNSLKQGRWGSVGWCALIIIIAIVVIVSLY